MVVIGQQLPVTQFQQFTRQAKAQFPQLARVGFYNAVGKLQTPAVLDESILIQLRAIYTSIITAAINLEHIAAVDWDRIDSQRRYNGAIRRRQIRAINKGFFGEKGKQL